MSFVYGIVLSILLYWLRKRSLLLLLLLFFPPAIWFRNTIIYMGLNSNLTFLRWNLLFPFAVFQAFAAWLIVSFFLFKTTSLRRALKLLSMLFVFGRKWIDLSTCSVFGFIPLGCLGNYGDLAQNRCIWLMGI